MAEQHTKQVNKAKNDIAKYVELQLKKNFVKNIIMGGDVAYEMILNKIDNGSTLEDIKNFCKQMLSKKGKQAMENTTKPNKNKTNDDNKGEN